MMVGTAERGGVLSQVDKLLANQRSNIAAEAQAFAESHSVGDQPSGSTSPWGKPASVFGDYDPAKARQPGPATSGPAAAQGSGPMNAPLAPGATVGDDDNASGLATGVAVITDREMTIEPQ